MTTIVSTYGFVFIFSALLATFGCNGKNSKDEGSGGLVGTSWSGPFRLKGAGGKLGEAQNIQFHFYTDLSFNVLLSDNLTSTVSGTYKDLPINKRLVLDIAKSTFEDFGKKGDTKIFTYALENKELVLNDDDGEYILSKESSDEKEEQTAIEGDWACRTDDGTRWQFNIADQEFRASKSKNGYKTVYFEGNVVAISTIEGQEISRLEIKSSNARDIVGSILRASVKDANLVVEEVNKQTDQADPASAVQCTR